MSAHIRHHIRSNVVGYLALFVALSGTAYAVDGPLAGQNTVGSQDIINGEVQNPDLGANAVGSGKVIDDNLQSRDVKDDTLQSDDVRDETLTGADVADSSLGGIDVANASLTSADIANSSLLGIDVATGTLNGGNVADDSLRGADIDEASLRTVPDADRLDGLDSADFVQGQLAGGGEVGLGRQVQAAGTTERILLRGNLGVLTSTCQSDGDAVLKYVNSLLSPEVDVADNIGGTAYRGDLATGENLVVHDAQAPLSPAAGQVQVHTSASTTGPQEAVTFLASARAAFNENHSCVFMGQVLYTDT